MNHSLSWGYPFGPGLWVFMVFSARARMVWWCYTPNAWSTTLARTGGCESWSRPRAQQCRESPSVDVTRRPKRSQWEHTDLGRFLIQPAVRPISVDTLRILWISVAYSDLLPEMTQKIIDIESSWHVILFVVQCFTYIYIYIFTIIELDI